MAGKHLEGGHLRKFRNIRARPGSDSSRILAAPPKPGTANREGRRPGSNDTSRRAQSTADGFVLDSVRCSVGSERMASAVSGFAAANVAAVIYEFERLRAWLGGAYGAWNLNLRDRAGNDTVNTSNRMPPTVIAGIGDETTEPKSHGNSGALKFVDDRCVSDCFAQSQVIGLRSVFTQPRIGPQPRLNPGQTTLSQEVRPMKCRDRTDPMGSLNLSTTQSISGRVGSWCSGTDGLGRKSSQLPNKEDSS